MAWVIRGYEGAEQIYEHHIAEPVLSDADVTAILQRLASKRLSYEEIVMASLPHGQAHVVGSLDVSLDAGAHGRVISTVGNPRFVAQSDLGGIEA